MSDRGGTRGYRAPDLYDDHKELRETHHNDSQAHCRCSCCGRANSRMMEEARNYRTSAERPQVATPPAVRHFQWNLPGVRVIEHDYPAYQPPRHTYGAYVAHRPAQYNTPYPSDYAGRNNSPRDSYYSYVQGMSSNNEQLGGHGTPNARGWLAQANTAFDSRGRQWRATPFASGYAGGSAWGQENRNFQKEMEQRQLEWMRRNGRSHQLYAEEEYFKRLGR